MLEIDGHRLTQSLAIIGYLDLRIPTTAAAPSGSPTSVPTSSRMALTVACDIHPLNNLRVLKYLEGRARRRARTARDGWYSALGQPRA